MNKKLSKDEVKRPDAFIYYTDKAIAWVEKHGKSIGAIILIGSLAGAGYVGFNKYQKHVEQTAQAELYALRVKMDKLIESFNEEPKEADKNESKQEKDFSKHFASIVADYQNYMQTYQKTNSALAAEIQLANLYASNEKWGEVIALINNLNTVSKENFYYGLLSMLLTQAQMNDNKCSEAISLLEVVSSVPEHKHLHPESLLRMGLCYEKQNDVEKAKQYFERVTREFEESEAATQAKNFLRYLTIKGNA